MINVIGIGQNRENMTLGAVKAIEESDVIIGYKKYINQIEDLIQDKEIVKKGMGDLVSSGSVSKYFKECIVTAGAKTGSAQTGGTVANGVFVCFAPFDEPEIAVAIVIEEGGSGSALAATAVNILNAYFAPSDIGTTLIPEGALLP